MHGSQASIWRNACVEEAIVVIPDDWQHILPSLCFFRLCKREKIFSHKEGYIFLTQNLLCGCLARKNINIINAYQHGHTR